LAHERGGCPNYGALPGIICPPRYSKDFVLVEDYFVTYTDIKIVVTGQEAIQELHKPVFGFRWELQITTVERKSKIEI